jgi:hypothetical protein
MEPSYPLLFDLLVLLLLFVLPIVVLSFIIAPRKGKNPILYGLLSLIPVMNIYIICYLISLTDRSVVEKLDAILLEKVEILKADAKNRF